jgi:D-sedoheptulose 7-phosphate isomerase
VEGSALGYFDRIGRLLASMEATDAQALPLAVDRAADQAVERILAVGGAGRCVVLIGNGGSASIAGHVQMDLCNRVGVRAHVFNDSPVLTALANDHGYEAAFELLVRLWLRPGDCLVAISSSGQSENILRSVRAARSRESAVLTLSGFRPDNPLRRLGDINFYVASTEYGKVEVAHHALAHFLTDRAAAIVTGRTPP